ncbi:MAG: hypothetical protein ACLQMT_04650 [Candidatus Acidiferrales bacterium]
MRNSRAMGLFGAFLAVCMLSGCGGASSSSTSQNSGRQTGAVYTMGTDSAPPLPSVVSVQVQLSSVMLTDGTTTANLLTTSPETVDFAKLNGLHELVDLNNVPANVSFTSAIITVGSVTIQYLDTTQSPPVLNTITPVVQPTTVTTPLAQPLTVLNNDLVGFFMDLDLKQSIGVNGSGNLNGNFTPTFDVKALSADDADAHIDSFEAGVVSVNAADGTFVIQGPHGRQYTVDTDANTSFDSNDVSLGDFNSNTIVEVSGTLNTVTRDIYADEVQVLSQDRFFADGLNTFVQTSAGQVDGVNLYTWAELPDLAGYPLGQIDTIPLTGNEKYFIANQPVASVLFGPNALTPGQRLAFGGKLNTSADPPTITVHRVVLRRQGQRGAWRVGSTVIQSGNIGSFSFNDDYLAGILLPQPLTVLTFNSTNFINLSGLAALTGAQPIPLRVVGFILVDGATGKPVMVARSIEEMTD